MLEDWDNNTKCDDKEGFIETLEPELIRILGSLHKHSMLLILDAYDIFKTGAITRSKELLDSYIQKGTNNVQPNQSV